MQNFYHYCESLFFFPFSGLKWHFGIIILFPTYKGVKRYGGQPCFRFDKQSWVVCQWRIGISETHQDITHDLHFSNLNHFLKDIQRRIFFQVNIISCLSQIFVTEMLYNSSKKSLQFFFSEITNTLYPNKVIFKNKLFRWSSNTFFLKIFPFSNVVNQFLFVKVLQSKTQQFHVFRW